MMNAAATVEAATPTVTPLSAVEEVLILLYEPHVNGCAHTHQSTDRLASSSRVSVRVDRRGL